VSPPSCTAAGACAEEEEGVWDARTATASERRVASSSALKSSLKPRGLQATERRSAYLQSCRAPLLARKLISEDYLIRSTFCAMLGMGFKEGVWFQERSLKPRGLQATKRRSAYLV
jgi:hypothetical protein